MITKRKKHRKKSEKKPEYHPGRKKSFAQKNFEWALLLKNEITDPRLVLFQRVVSPLLDEANLVSRT